MEKIPLGHKIAHWLGIVYPSSLIFGRCYRYRCFRRREMRKWVQK